MSVLFHSTGFANDNDAGAVNPIIITADGHGAPAFVATKVCSAAPLPPPTFPLRRSRGRGGFAKAETVVASVNHFLLFPEEDADPIIPTAVAATSAARSARQHRRRHPSPQHRHYDINDNTRSSRFAVGAYDADVCVGLSDGDEEEDDDEDVVEIKDASVCYDSQTDDTASRGDSFYSAFGCGSAPFAAQLLPANSGSGIGVSKDGEDDAEGAEEPLRSSRSYSSHFFDTSASTLRGSPVADSLPSRPPSPSPAAEREKVLPFACAAEAEFDSLFEGMSVLACEDDAISVGGCDDCEEEDNENYLLLIPEPSASSALRPLYMHMHDDDHGYAFEEEVGHREEGYDGGHASFPAGGDGGFFSARETSADNSAAAPWPQFHHVSPRPHPSANGLFVSARYRHNPYSTTQGPMVLSAVAGGAAEPFAAWATTRQREEELILDSSEASPVERKEDDGHTDVRASISLFELWRLHRQSQMNTAASTYAADHRLRCANTSNNATTHFHHSRRHDWQAGAAHGFAAVDNITYTYCNDGGAEEYIHYSNTYRDADDGTGGGAQQRSRRAQKHLTNGTDEESATAARNHHHHHSPPLPKLEFCMRASGITDEAECRARFPYRTETIPFPPKPERPQYPPSLAAVAPVVKCCYYAQRPHKACLMATGACFHAHDDDDGAIVPESFADGNDRSEERKRRADGESVKAETGTKADGEEDSGTVATTSTVRFIGEGDVRRPFVSRADLAAAPCQYGEGCVVARHSEVARRVGFGTAQRRAYDAYIKELRAYATANAAFRRAVKASRAETEAMYAMHPAGRGGTRLGIVMAAR